MTSAIRTSERRPVVAVRPKWMRRPSLKRFFLMRHAAKDADTNREPGLAMAHVRMALHRRLLLVLVCPLAFAGLAGTVSLFVPNTYEASVMLQVDARARPGAGGNESAAARPITLQVERLRSRTVLDDVARSESLGSDPEFSASPLTRRIRSAFGLEASPIDIVERSLWRRLSVSELRNTNIVQVRFSAREPEKAARIANAIATAYLKQDAAEKWRTAGVAADTTGPAASASQRTFDEMMSRFGLSAQLANARLLAPSMAPEEPAAPQRLHWLLIAGWVGLIAGIGLALLLESASPAAPTRLRTDAALPCGALSSLPSIEDLDVSGLHTARLVVTEPDCAYAHAIYGTVRELQHRIGERNLVLVTSSVDGEGSEHVASNIAHHLALRGDRTLLVDGDMRSRLLTRHLQAEGARGLLDQLAMDGALDDVLLLDGLTGLHFLPASGGTGSPTAGGSMSPSDALKSARFDAGIASLRRRFDTIVVSAPPLLPVIDSKLIAERADHIVFVTSRRKTEPQTAEAALRTLGRLREKVSGAVITDAAEDHIRSVMGLAEIMTEARQAVGLLVTSSKAA